MWLMPSLMRPHLMKRFFEAYKKTEGSTQGLLLVDEKDSSMEDYKKLSLPIGWKLITTKSRLMADKVHEVWDLYKDCDWVGILNDDHIPKTLKWDMEIVKSINGSNVVHTNDNWFFGRRSMVGAIAFSGPLLRALGYMFPGDIKHLHSDDAWAMLFGQSNCITILPNVVVEHDHAYKNREFQDATFKSINGEQGLVNGQGVGGLWKSDGEAFNKWRVESYKSDLKKVIDLQPKAGILVATCFGGPMGHVGYFDSLMKSIEHLRRLGIPTGTTSIKGSPLLAFARNVLVNNLMYTPYKKILFVDSDQMFQPNDILALYGSSRPIIAGVTPHKKLPINLNFYPLDEDRKYFKSVCSKSLKETLNMMRDKGIQNGEIEVSRAGTGFLMIDRTVFETMESHVDSYLAYEERKDVHSEFFKMGKSEDTGMYAGEDWHFCELAKKLNYPIYINAGVQVLHEGSFVYSCNIESGANV